MPPRVRFAAETILRAAVDLVRDEGIEALTARRLAARLGSSTGPLFSHFENMEAITEQVLERVMADFVGRAVQAGEAGGDDADPVVGASLAWLSFAAEEPRLYEALFLRQHPWHVGWGAHRRDLARRMAAHPRYAGLDSAGRFALVGRASVVLHGLGLELWSGRLRADSPAERRRLVQALVIPVVDAALSADTLSDLHTTPALPRSP